ncbi:MAG: substrate-binding domain-containing protein, partial [Spirochaetaceae bacterium]|nr:substrate-binding domain-containing protein [Spirochaetaceae bacterium]
MKNTSRRLRIALITPFLSGYYLGEMANQIRCLSTELDFDLVTIQTRDFNVYDIPLALHNIDGVILLIDAVRPVLAKEIIRLGIPVISIGKDYFPLEMEVVLIDNKMGVYQAMHHLSELGHKKIGFSGDVSIYDIRLRYNAYLQYLEESHLEHDLQTIFSTDDSFFRGGFETAEAFLERGRPCTAIVFSTDLNAIGFQERILSEGLRIPEDIAIVGFDNIYLTKLKTPQLTTIDQNLTELTEYAVNRILKTIEGDDFIKSPKILPCHLVIRGSTTEKIINRSRETDLTRTVTTDFVEGILANNYEAVKSVVRSNFKSIYSLTPLFGPFMQWGCYAKWNSEGNPEDLVIDQIYFDSCKKRTDLPSKGDIFNQRNFPPHALYNLCDEKNHLVTILPISVENKKRGILVMVGKAEEEESYGNYSMFTNYLDLLAFGMEKETLLNEVLIREQTTKSLAEELEIISNNATDGIWIWDLKSNLIEWNLRAINMLGFTEEIDIKAMKNIPFYERIHPEEVEEVKAKIQAHLNHGIPLRGEFRMKTKDNEYIWIYTSGEAVLDMQGIPTRIIGSVSDVSERHRQQEKIKYMAFYDSLTGLPNRAMIREKLLSHISEKVGGKLAVMLLDLDRFKYINDSYGHDAGDRLLKHTSEMISS